MQGHVGQRHAGHFSGLGTRHLGHLGAGPKLDLAVFNLRRAIQRLHGGVGQIRGVINGFDDAAGLVVRRLDIAFFIKRGTAFFCCSFCKAFLDGGRVQRTLGPLLPDGVYRRRPLACVPGGFAHHRKTTNSTCVHGQLHYAFHPGDRQGGFAVDGTGCAAQHGAQAHGGINQTGRTCIQAKLRAAIDLGGDVQTWGWRTDQFPVFAVLEFGLCQAHTRCVFGKVAVMAFFARFVLHHAIGHGDFSHRHLPGLRRGSDQAGAGQRRRQAQVVPGIGHTAGTTGGVQAQLAHGLVHQPMRHLDLDGLLYPFGFQRVKRQCRVHHEHIAVNGVGTGLLQPHPAQRHIKFFGHQHRQGRVHALAHLSPWHGQNDGSVLGDLDPAVQRDLALGRQHVFGLAQAGTHWHNAPAHHQRAGGTQAAQNPGTALHAAPPLFPTAVLAVVLAAR